MRSAPYHEAAAHLVLMAYLQRVINGGGRIEREYAAKLDDLRHLRQFGVHQRRQCIQVLPGVETKTRKARDTIQ